jgi:hypothetical protein
VEKIPLVELASFKQLTDEACLAPRDIALDALGDTGLPGRDVEPKQTAGVTVRHLFAHAHSIEAVVPDPGNDRIPIPITGTLSLTPPLCQGGFGFGSERRI